MGKNIYDYVSYREGYIFGYFDFICLFGFLVWYVMVCLLVDRCLSNYVVFWKNDEFVLKWFIRIMCYVFKNFFLKILFIGVIKFLFSIM